MNAILSSLRPFPPKVKPLAGYRRLAGAPDAEPVRAQKESPPSRSLVAQLPILFLVALILVPQPSLVLLPIILYKHALMTSRALFTRLFLSSFLYLACNTFILLCVLRDPGRVRTSLHDEGKPPGHAISEEAEEEEEMTLAEFMKGPPPPQPPPHPSERGRWCKVCNAPKPERAHHCSSCKRCVLKMDHHCVWLARCVGFRTLPSFFFFLISVTAYSLFALSLGGPQIYRVLFVPGFEYMLADDEIAFLVHSAVLTMLGFAFGLSLIGFVGYHAYLISTNQTTLEQLHPYVLTPHLPPRGPMPFDLPNQDPSNPPSAPAEQLRWEEYLMNNEQRRALRSARSKIRVWDLGFKRNWSQAFGGRGKGGRWLFSGKGDGQTFPHNPRAEAMLERLVQKLERLGPTPESARQSSGWGGESSRPADWSDDD